MSQNECFDRCPHCGEILWIEWGFMSPEKCMIQEWYNRYPRPQPLYTMEDIVEVQEDENHE